MLEKTWSTTESILFCFLMMKPCLAFSILLAGFLFIPSHGQGDEGQELNSMGTLAQEFLTFRQKLSTAATLPLETPEDVRLLLDYLHVENEKRLIQSWFAHHALIVAETPAYVAGVQTLLQTQTSDQLLHSLRTTRNYARYHIDGVEEAMERLRAEKDDDWQRLLHLTNFLLDTAKKWETRDWGKTRRNSFEDILPSALASLRLFIARAEEVRFPRAAHAEIYTPTDLILTLGARHILGTAASIVSEIEHPDALQCLHWARLNLDQCMVSSHTPSEEAWCAGVHGVEEVARCWRFLLPDGE